MGRYEYIMERGNVWEEDFLRPFSYALIAIPSTLPNASSIPSASVGWA